MEPTYYSQANLTTEAKRLAQRTHCGECNKSMKLVSWEIALAERTVLLAKVSCRTHTGTAHVRVVL